ncbi:MAG: hypothetical protein J6Z00_02825 [Clostridia bacterium]|nr:hypothetical protein [Clostridia bacterium]
MRLNVSLKIRYALFMVVSALFIAAIIVMNKNILLNNVLDFNTVEESGEFQKDQYVEMHVDTVLSQYAWTKHTVNLIPLGKDYHYMVVTDKLGIISVSLNKKKDIEAFERLMNGADETVTIKGVIQGFHPEIHQYFEETYTELNEKWDHVMDGVTLYSVEVDGTKSIVVIVLEILLFVGLLIFFMVSFLKERDKEKETTFDFPLQEAPVTISSSNDEGSKEI